MPANATRNNRALAASLAFGMLLVLAALPARSAPDGAAAPAAAPASAAASNDAILNLLQERGLLPTNPAQIAAQVAEEVEGSPLVQQVRDTATEMVVSAMNFLGVRYKRGGNSAETGFDCSGFTRYVFENSLGLVLPRRADQQAKTAGLQDVNKDELKPGDLVFFNTMRRAFSHVGIYVGEGKFIHAPRSGAKVRIEDMGAKYWAKRFNGARRADLGTPALVEATEATTRQ
jgi:cell wall-associated NlpC family hydrolase